MGRIDVTDPKVVIVVLILDPQCKVHPKYFPKLLPMKKKLMELKFYVTVMEVYNKM